MIAILFALCVLAATTNAYYPTCARIGERCSVNMYPGGGYPGGGYPGGGYPGGGMYNKRCCQNGMQRVRCQSMGGMGGICRAYYGK